MRWGGEEFLLLLVGVNEHTAQEVLDRIRESQAALVIPAGDKNITVTISIGFAQIDPAQADPFSVAYNNADMALYKAKSEGRNRVRSAAV